VIVTNYAYAERWRETLSASPVDALAERHVRPGLPFMSNAT
jgi:hypothetical protein